MLHERCGLPLLAALGRCPVCRAPRPPPDVGGAVWAQRPATAPGGGGGLERVRGPPAPPPLPAAALRRFSLRMKSLTGLNVLLAVRSDWTVWELLELLRDTKGIPPQNVRPIAAGVQLGLAKRLHDHGICEGSVVHYVMRF